MLRPSVQCGGQSVKPICMQRSCLTATDSPLSCCQTTRSSTHLPCSIFACARIFIKHFRQASSSSTVYITADLARIARYCQRILYTEIGSHVPPLRTFPGINHNFAKLVCVMKKFDRIGYALASAWPNTLLFLLTSGRTSELTRLVYLSMLSDPLYF